MAMSSCDEDDFQFPEFNESTDMGDPKFVLGMLFTSGAVFREAVRKHAIVHQRAIKLKKNLSDKIKWVCTEGCNWKCYGVKQKRSDTIQIKALDNQHTCNPTWEQKNLNSTWIAKVYEDEIRMNPSWPASAFQSKVTNDFKCKISMSMVYGALKKAKENINGKHEAEYGQLWTYANELKKIMPSSTVKLMSEAAGAGVEGRRFKRLYVCLGPLKEGFLDGCRPIIGLDGCHLKGPLGGILLTAVGIDPNDGMYPLAWAQVEAENNDSWDWFLGLLKEDLMIDNAGSYTFISDRQKGLVHALEKQVPTAEHRFCVMHLYKNLYKDHKGIGVRKLLWLAARSTTDYYFNKHMNDMKQVAPRAHAWLAAKPRSQWTRSSFRDICKSDMFVNNNYEVFNNAINKFRDQAIITMFKNIHTTCMERIQRRKWKIEQKNTIFCSNPLKKLHKSMENASKCRPVWNGDHKYQVTMTEGGYQIVVDLQNKVCACRKWQLTGIPCFHACACIFFQKQNPLDYMHECHKKEWYLKMYSHYLQPMNGQEFWEETEAEPLLPPVFKVAPGRPKKKRDKRSDIVQTRENDPTMLKRTGTTLHCSYCQEAGHNTRSCKSKKIDEKSSSNPPLKNPVKCSKCKGEGHNKRTCTQQKAGESESKGPSKNVVNEINASANEHNDSASTQHNSAAVKTTPRKKVLAGLQKRASPLKHGNLLEAENKTAENTHGGIIKPFKAPTQQVLGVDSVKGQTFTSLKNLEAARLKMQKNLVKKTH